MKKLLFTTFILVSQALFSEAGSHEGHQSNKMQMQMTGHSSFPAGLNGLTMHGHGFMLSVKRSSMVMEGNIYQGNDIESSEVLGFKNPLTDAPYNLSVVPEKMNMKMTMFMGMYALSKNINLTGMVSYSSKEMSLDTYKPMMGRDFLGSFETSSSDLSSVSFGSCILLKDLHDSKTHLNFSIIKSIGDRTVKGKTLTPMGLYMDMTLPYAMQSGDKSIKMDLSLTNLKEINKKLSWGNQLKRNFSLSEDVWSFGDILEFNTWLQYKHSKAISLSSRLKLVHQQKISGFDSLIMAPVQTANPENYGGRKVYLALGANYLLGNNNKISIEFLSPIRQDKNNLQMKTRRQLVLGYQKSF